MPAPQPDLRVFLTLVIGGCGLVVVGRSLEIIQWPRIGWPVALVGAITVLIALACLVAAATPRLARLVAVATVCGFSLLAILTLWTYAARQQARKQQVLNNLRQLGVAVQEHDHLTPNGGLGSRVREQPPRDQEFTWGGSFFSELLPPEPASGADRSGR
jgi:hypothetical protein